MKIVMTGAKATGKSTLARRLADELGLPLFEKDQRVEELYAAQTGVPLSCRDIYRQAGAAAFRALEVAAARELAERNWCIIATGGSSMLQPEVRRALRRDAVLVLLTAPPAMLWSRVQQHGLPAYLDSDNPEQQFTERVQMIEEVLTPFADVLVDVSAGDLARSCKVIIEGIGTEMATRCTAPNTCGEVIRVTTFGESHGVAIGCELDGVQPGTLIDLDEIQRELDRRRPGQSALSTPRKERDQVRVLSGVFEGKATGAPICMIMMSEDQRPAAYEGLRDLFRPGHADFTFWKKYGIRDYRGGGRSSGRETAGRVAAGAVARQLLRARGVQLCAYALEIAGIRAQSFDAAAIEQNPVRCPDPVAAQAMAAAILKAKEDKDSVGGIIELRITGMPAGLGDPVFGKLDARLAAALLSIGATMGFEIGAGFDAARRRGSENNDAMQDGALLSNNAGGIVGGISNGNEIVIRVAIKPTSSIEKPQRTIDIEGRNRDVVVEGRHDPCIVPRVVPVIEAMAALVLLDAWEMQTRIRPGWPDRG
jgi:chorismate synthase